MSRNRSFIFTPRHPFFLVAILGLLLVPAALLASTPCVIPGNGGGTVDMPPAGCPYVSPADFHLIVNGLPVGTTVNVGVEHSRFVNVVRTPGGPLGGENEKFQSTLMLNMKGTGTLSSYQRIISMTANCESNTAPRTPGQPVQSFDTDMFRIQGQLPAGDPDFDLLRITAGTSFGMPSPGHTTLTKQQNGQWNIDSFFDITYTIDFIGHTPGPFAGRSGSTTGTIRMGSGQPAPGPCVVSDNGTGTVDLPPVGCGYLSPQDVHNIINGLPAGTTIRIGAQHQEFFNITHTPGGPLGGEVEQFGSFLALSLSGTGSLAGYHRTINIQTQCQANTGPRVPGQGVQSFDTEMFGIQGQITGDPDFDLLRITAGNGFNMPSPGHTTLTRLPSGQWNIDSFFDITYRIDFVGHSPGPLAGRSGSTTGTIRMQSGQTVPPPSCVVADNGSGTVDLPPEGCPYLSPADVHKILDGLPAGTTIRLGAAHQGFFHIGRTPDPTGGETEDFDSSLLLQLSGTGDLADFNRVLKLEPHCLVHSDARSPGSAIQSFDTDMRMLQAQLPIGDPDFDLLRITAGTDLGMPSPGHTVLTPAGTGPGPGGTWNVYSFFDITYRIDYVGAPGGRLGGRSGSTTGTIRMQTGQVPLAVPGQILSKDVRLSNRPNPFGEGTTVEYRLPVAASVRLTVYDAMGRRVRSLIDERMPAGPHAMFWDGLNESGRKVGSGTYIIRLSMDGKIVATRRAALIR